MNECMNILVKKMSECTNVPEDCVRELGFILYNLNLQACTGDS